MTHPDPTFETGHLVGPYRVLRLIGRHPYLAGMNHLAASRWLLATGDTARASRLLTWTHAILFDRMAYQGFASAVLEPYALRLRARLAEARGDRTTARTLYREFLQRYDRPPRAHSGWIEEALGALRRLDADRRSR